MQHAAGRSVRTLGWPRLSAMGFVNALARLDADYRARRTLERFDDRMLRDIGVTRAEAEHEIAQPFAGW